MSLSSIRSSACKAGHSEVEKDGELSGSEPAALECDRHVYKSVLEGGDIPLQGLRALNKRHASSSSSKGRNPVVLHRLPVEIEGAGSSLGHAKAFHWDGNNDFQWCWTVKVSGIHVFPFNFLLESTRFFPLLFFLLFFVVALFAPGYHSSGQSPCNIHFLSSFFLLLMSSTFHQTLSSHLLVKSLRSKRYGERDKVASSVSSKSG